MEAVVVAEATAASHNPTVPNHTVVPADPVAMVAAVVTTVTANTKVQPMPQPTKLVDMVVEVVVTHMVLPVVAMEALEVDQMVTDPEATAVHPPTVANRLVVMMREAVVMVPADLVAMVSFDFF